MLTSIFTSVLQNRSFLSWKICFFTKICICLQNVIIFAKINSIFVTDLRNKPQTLRWKFYSHHKIQVFNLFLYLSQIYLSKISAAYWHVWMHHVCALAGEKWVESLGKWKMSSSAQGLYNILSAKHRRRWREGKDGTRMEGEERKRLILQCRFIRADKQKSPEWEQSLPCLCALACCTVRLLTLHWENGTNIDRKPKLTA